MVIFKINPAQFVKQLGIVRIMPQSFAQNLFPFGNLVHLCPQPKGGNDVGLDVFRIEFGGDFQPGQNFPHFPACAQIIRRPAFIQMRVPVGNEMAVEGVNKIKRRTHETGFIAPVVAGDRAGILGHVRRFERCAIVENGWIITAVIIDVRLAVKGTRQIIFVHRQSSRPTD